MQYMLKIFINLKINKHFNLKEVNNYQTKLIFHYQERNKAYMKIIYTFFV